MTSTHTADLPFTELPPPARQAHIFPDLHTLLLSVAPLCDHGCTVTFTKHQCTITCPDGARLQCPHNQSGLWTWPQTATNTQHNTGLQHTPKATNNLAAPAINRHSNTPADLVAFAHAALFPQHYPPSKQHFAKGSYHHSQAFQKPPLIDTRRHWMQQQWVT